MIHSANHLQKKPGQEQVMDNNKRIELNQRGSFVGCSGVFMYLVSHSGTSGLAMNIDE
jgi:hypothetical protein